MKEILKPTLTGLPKTPYYRGGDVFMPTEGQSNMPPTNSQPANPEHSEAPRGQRQPVSSERQEEARRLLKQPNLNTEVRGALERFLREGGKPFSGSAEDIPDLSRQEARIWLETLVSSGLPISPASINERIWRENGISVDDLRTKSPEELINLLRERVNPREPAAGAGGAGQGGGEPPTPPSATPPEDQSGSPQESGEEGAGNLEDLIRRTTNEQLKSILKKIGGGIHEVGSSADLKDEFIAEQMAAIRKLIDEKQIFDADEIIANNLMSQLSQLRMSKLGSLEGIIGQDRDLELKKIALEIKKVFSNDEVRKELVENNPNLNSLTELKNLMDKLIDPTKQDILLLANTIADEDGILIRGKEKLVISEESKKLLYEWLVEKIISIPDSTPDAHYNIGSFYITANLDSLIDIARRRFDDNGETSGYLNELRHYRQAMHELNLALRVGEQYKEFVLKELSSNGFDFINNRLTGANGIIRLYEKTYANKVKETRQWLTGQDVSNIDNEVRQIVNDQFENGEIARDNRVLTKWEVERALRLGKILFSGSQRKAIYSGFGDLPPNTASRIGSLPEEYIVRSIYNWKIFAPRFYGSDPASRRFIQHVFEHAKSLNKGAFNKGVFGVKPDTLIENSFGGYDMQSHGWRSELLFLGNQLFKTEDGAERTLEEILNSKVDEYTRGEIDEYIWGYPSLSEKAKKGGRSKKEEFSDDVRKIVLGQRVYLSSLARYGNFSPDLKADIWRKRASLMPSTAVTLLPDEILETEQEKELWEEIRHKVYRAEERRIQRESLVVKPLREVQDEAEKFERGKAAQTTADREIRYEFVDSYCRDKDGFSDDDRRLLRKIIDKAYYQAVGTDGKKMPGLAERLAETNMSFNLIIDDTPTIAWKKKGEQYGNAGFETADFIRLLSSDQDNFNKGWEPITALTESPQSANFEIFEKAVESIGTVIGRGDAQKKIEPFIAATAKMYSTDTATEFIPGAMTVKRMLDRPTSEIEGYFKKTYISWNAEQRKNFFVKLLQAKALGNEGFERMRKETKSTQEWVLLTLFKFWVELIGFEAAQQMFKAFLPENK